MAAATVDHHHNHHHVKSLPLIDIRLLSHSELLSLSLCSSSTTCSTTINYDDEDRDSTPKIDASVFNESAGSRKQTFSRLRLAPRNSSPLRPQIPSPAPVKPLDEENSQVISLLKSLLNIPSHSSASITADVDVDVDADDDRLISVPVEFEGCAKTNANGHIETQNIPVELVTCSETKRKRGRPRKDENFSSRWVIATQNGVSQSERQIDKTMLTPIHGNSQNSTEKRKRGRPRKIKDENVDVDVNVNVDVSVHENSLVSPVGSSVSCETGKRKRGRPRKISTGVSVVNKMVMGVVSESPQNMPSGGVTCETRKRKRGRPRKNESLRGGFGGVKNEEAKMVVGENEKEMVMENKNGVFVNVVPLGNVEDPFWEELRRTEEMKKNNELLGFWTGSNGDW